MTVVEVICFLIAVSSHLAQVVFGDSPPPQCLPGLIVDCRHDFEDLVWAKDENDKCKTILNQCIFNQANCARYREGRPLFRKISKEVCQTLCVDDCTHAPKKAICAHRAGRYCTFPSQCEWEKHLCNAGEYWFQEGAQPCGPNPVPCFA